MNQRFSYRPGQHSTKMDVVVISITAGIFDNNVKKSASETPYEERKQFKFLEAAQNGDVNKPEIVCDYVKQLIIQEL